MVVIVTPAVHWHRLAPAPLSDRRSALLRGLLMVAAAAAIPNVRAAGPVDPSQLVAAVTVERPVALAGTHFGYYSTFSALPPPTEHLSLWAPTGDAMGCSAPIDIPPDGPSVAIVRRGECTFVEKALIAQKTGAHGLIVVSDSEEVVTMGAGNLTEQALQVAIFAVGVRKSFGDQLLAWVAAKPIGESASLLFKIYNPSPLDTAEALLVCLATSLVIAGAAFATADLRVNPALAALAPRRDEVFELNNEIAFSFCAMGSMMLLILYFFMRYMIYFLIAAFCVGGASCTMQIGSGLLQHLVPRLKRHAFSIPVLGPVALADIISSVPTSLVVLSWLLLRNTEHGWIFQDIIGAGFLCWMQRTLRLPNIKVATVLLSAMFFFDIFWVFLSPMFFKKSVMVEVATGGGTGESVPMLLRIPAIGDPLGHDRMLGFGDIALPGLLVSYLRRHDLLTKRAACRGYFVPSVIGYFVGLCATVVALVLMRKGQPALLYLVPGTLGTTLVLAWRRSQLAELWRGAPPVAEGAEVSCPTENAEQGRVLEDLAGA